MGAYNVKRYQTDDETRLKVYISYYNDPLFKKPGNIKYRYDIIRKILGRKNICLRCHSLHVINYTECPNCGAKTIKYNSEILQSLVYASIEKLRIGIPGDKHQKHYYSMIGPLKGELQYYQEYLNQNIFIGYDNGMENYKNFYPVYICDLERFFLVGVNLWNYLYSKDLGTFIGMEQVDKPYNINIPRTSLNNYSYYLFAAYHYPGNKNLLVLSRDNKADINNLKDLKSLDEKFKRTDNGIDLNQFTCLHDDFKDAEWYLFFNSDENIIIMPQERSELDIRSIEELIRLWNLIIYLAIIQGNIL